MEMETTSNLMAPHGLSEASGRQDNDQHEPHKKPIVRKRTKTGCITCRKRRIKCDEGRPTCANCIRSKRVCEGYHPRVVFKEPLSAAQGPFQPPGFAGNNAGDMANMHAQFARAGMRATLTPIAPRPLLRGRLGRHGPLGIAEDVFFTRQPGVPAAQPPQNFDFNIRNDVGPPEQAPMLPNPLMAPQNGHGISAIASSSRSTPGNNRQDGPGASDSRLTQPTSGVDHHHVSPYDDEDDDAMSISDDDAILDGSSHGAQTVSRVWTGTRMDPRSFDYFANSGALFSYMDSPANSELRNRGEVIVFAHFLNVTSPTISMYERMTASDQMEKQDFSQSKGHNLWSYVLPVIAFHHPGLLHAMLALASFQLAKIKGQTHVAAIRHYSRAIRRVARNVNSLSRRTHIATIAATLLLGYFEVWMADHKNWCKHLNGASILLREIPLQTQARRCLPRRRQLEQQRSLIDPTFVPKELEQLDYELLRTISGSSIHACDYGLEEDEVETADFPNVTKQDIQKFETLADLFWWFCKMDVYQSVLGGTKLFMDYQDWTQIPPRAPIARFGQIFGTYDHLILLLGRVANFAAKDLARKRKAFKAPGPSSGNTPPQFPGIIPVQGGFQTPMGFSPPRNVSPQSEQTDESDPRSTLDMALEEWESIQKAFDAIRDSFGPDFRPLSTEFSDKRESPFGLAVQYRTYAISGIWMNFYMGLIHLHRAHPNMPPAAMQAAGMAARETETYANQIGRIASGLWADSPRSTPDPLLVAALIECSFCLFVAGVQYHVDSQRHWLIQRMSDVGEYTGWQSAKQIATGCEAVWKKAAQMGRGPPYISRTRTVEDHAQSVWRTARRLDEVFEQEGDRRIVLARADRAQFALGLLAAEEDLARLELRDDRT